MDRRKRAGNWLVIIAAALMFVPRPTGDSGPLPGVENSTAPLPAPDSCAGASCAAFARPVDPAVLMGGAAGAAQQLGALGILMALSRLCPRQPKADDGSHDSAQPVRAALALPLARLTPPDSVRRIARISASAADPMLAAARLCHRGPPTV